MKRIPGCIVFATGIVLLAFACHFAQAPLQERSNTLAGRYSNQTVLYFAAGIAGAVGGALLAVSG